MYCNYSKDRFNNEITFITPSWADIPEGNVSLLPKGDWNLKPTEAVWCIRPTNIHEEVVIPDKPGYLSLLEVLGRSEFEYQIMIKDGLQPQQAREVLPLCTKSELIMTGFASDWRYLLDLRLFGKTGKPHPDMFNLMQKAEVTMKKAGIWHDIMDKPSKFE